MIQFDTIHHATFCCWTPKVIPLDFTLTRPLINLSLSLWSMLSHKFNHTHTVSKRAFLFENDVSCRSAISHALKNYCMVRFSSDGETTVTAAAAYGVFTTQQRFCSHAQETIISDGCFLFDKPLLYILKGDDLTQSHMFSFLISQQVTVYISCVDAKP